MSIPKMIDKRQAWLDGVSVEAMAVVSKLTKRTKAGITLSDREDMMLELCSGYLYICLLYTSPSPRDYAASRMPSSA